MGSHNDTCMKTYSAPYSVNDLFEFSKKPEKYLGSDGANKKWVKENCQSPQYRERTREALKAILNDVEPSAMATIDKKQNTPLHYFAQYRRTELLEIALNKVDDLSILAMKNAANQTPAQLARKTTYVDNQAFFKKLAADAVSLARLIDEIDEMLNINSPTDNPLSVEIDATNAVLIMSRLEEKAPSSPQMSLTGKFAGTYGNATPVRKGGTTLTPETVKGQTYSNAIQFNTEDDSIFVDDLHSLQIDATSANGFLRALGVTTPRSPKTPLTGGADAVSTPLATPCKVTFVRTPERLLNMETLGKTITLNQSQIEYLKEMCRSIKVSTPASEPVPERKNRTRGSLGGEGIHKVKQKLFDPSPGDGTKQKYQSPDHGGQQLSPTRLQQLPSAQHQKETEG